MLKLFDSHCHLDVTEFDVDRHEVLHRASLAGVQQILVPAIKAKTWSQLISLCAQNSALYPALGLHPVYQNLHRPADLELLDEYLSAHRPVAVGEIGLDYFVPENNKAAQQTLFEAQLSLAQSYDLPVILHVRKAHDQVLHTLKKISVKGGICHAYNGSYQQAQQYIDLGFKLGFGGTLTYKRSSKIRDLAKKLDLSAIVLETDAPDMVVNSHQHERNSPEYLPEIFLALQQLRDIDATKLAEQLLKNTYSALALDGFSQ